MHKKTYNFFSLKIENSTSHLSRNTVKKKLFANERQAEPQKKKDEKNTKNERKGENTIHVAQSESWNGESQICQT